MLLNRNGLAVSLLSLLQGTSASHNPIGGPISGDITNYESIVSGTPSATAIFADVVAPSGSTAVVDFVKSTPPGISSPGASSTPSVPACSEDPCTVTLTPVRFAPSVATWIQHLTTTVTVPEASTPVIHFSAIQGEPGSGQSATADASQPPYDTTTAAPNSSPSADPTPNQPPQSGAPAGETTTTSGNAPAKTPRGSESGAPNSPGLSTPYVPGTSSDSTPPQSNTAADTSSTPPAPSPPATNSKPGPSGVPTPNNTKTTPKPSGPGPAGSTTAKDTANLTTAESASDSTSSVAAETASESTTSSSPTGPSGSGTPGSNGHGTSGKPPGSKTSGRPAVSTSKSGGSTGLPGSSSTTSSNSGSSSTSDGSTAASTSTGSSSSSSSETTESGSFSTPFGSTTAGTTTSSNAFGSATATKSTPLTTPGPSQTSSTSQSTDSVSTSASLENVQDNEDMSSMLLTLTGTSSSDAAALLSAEETRAPATTEAWEDLMSEAPTVTASSNEAAQTTEGVAMAGWLTKFNDNVQISDLTDKDTYDKIKDNLSKTNDKVKDYVENRKSSDSSDGGSSDDSCGSGGGLFDIFKTASCFVNKASNEIENGSKDIGNLINSGWDLTSQGMSEIEKELPDVDDITPEIEQEFKDNIKHFSEITESLESLEKENEKENDNKTESQSQSSTSSDSTTSTTATETTSTSTSTGESAGITCSPKCSACQSAEESADAAAASSYSSHSASVSASLLSNKKGGLNVARQTAAPSIKKRADEDDDPYAYLDDPNRTGLEALNFEFFSNRFDAFEDGALAEGSVEVKHTMKGSLTSSRFIEFRRNIARVWVGGLTGCTAVGIVSEQGAWLGHFWESPTMEQDSKDTPAWEKQVIKVLKETQDRDTTPAYPLSAAGESLHPDNNVRIFIMTPADGDSPMYSETIGWLEDLLTGDGAPWAGVEITRHLYDKPEVDKTGIDEIQGKNQTDTEKKRGNELAKRTEKAMEKYFLNPDELNGRMMVEFAPRQTIDPDDGKKHDLMDPPVAMYRIWMGTRNDQEQWCPYQNQRPEDGNNQKRAAACSLSSDSSTSMSSGTSTSTDSTLTDSTSTETSSGTTTAATTTSSPMCELEVIGSSYSVCTCSSTMGSHTLSHAMLKPASTDCGDIKTFPMTSFIQVPTPTQTSYICANTPKDMNGNQGAFCQCSSTMTKTDATTTDTSPTQAVVSLPYVMGSQTVLEQCADITEFPSDGISATSDAQTQPTRTFTDFTSTDFANNNKVYVYTAGAEYYDYNKYGAPEITGPVIWTTGIGDPVKEFVHDYTSTNDGGTVYAYAEATGDGDGDVVPAGTPTATSVPEPTHNCVKFAVPAPGDIYNSATEQFLFTMWGIDHWSETEDIERDIESALKDAGVESDISIEADTGRWGTVAMWNNGRNSHMTKEVREGLQNLGMGKPACNPIAKTGDGVNFPVKDSAVEEMDWIEENHPNAIKPPYPLED